MKKKKNISEKEDKCLTTVCHFTFSCCEVIMREACQAKPATGLCSEGLSLIQREVWTLALFPGSSSLNPYVESSDKEWLKVSKVDTERSAFVYRGSWASLIEMSTVWFRVNALAHKTDLIQDDGFGHAVSAAPLERFEPEISCMDHQSCLGNGAPVKTLDTEPGVSSHVCKSSLLAHQC